MYADIIEKLRQFYDENAVERDQSGIDPWKAAERQLFLEYLLHEGKQSLLEIGAGPGRDGQFFQDHGLTVVCTDLSPEMVARCRSRGLTAHIMDFSQLNFREGSFDAVFALNCLLHVPKQKLPTILTTIRNLLVSDGLFYYGVYGGAEHEGVWEADQHTIKRFFAYYTDEKIRSIVAQQFEIVAFRPIPIKGRMAYHFQSMILRKKPEENIESGDVPTLS
jgi:cyclopropane fatty-acyl-phospholipid synthase-like methyltransferase